MKLSRRSSVRELARRNPEILAKLTKRQQQQADDLRPVFGIAIEERENDGHSS